MSETVLITGGNGFLAQHIIKQLLEQGFTVRATVRGLAKADAVRATMITNQVPHLERLTFAELDLTQDTGFDAAMQGVTYVKSVAAPVFVNGKTADVQTANAATAGTLRILQAAERAHVRRVVMTSNLGAVGFSNFAPHHQTTEADWTDVNQRNLSPYEKSKLVAEKAAWDYLRATNSPLEFAVVNPGAMLGAALDAHVSGSFGLVTNLLDGNIPALPQMSVNVIDVADAATIHVRALTTPAAAGKRFIAVADQPISLPAMAHLIRSHYPQLAGKVPHRQIPNWLLALMAKFNAQAKEANMLLRINHDVSNQRAKSVLGWTPTSTAEQAVLGALKTIIASRA